jgi:hypothetical protein
MWSMERLMVPITSVLNLNIKLTSIKFINTYVL